MRLLRCSNALLSSNGFKFVDVALLLHVGANRQSRLQQLIDWCGGEKFNGCLIFDECHKAKHFVPVSDLHLNHCILN